VPYGSPPCCWALTTNERLEADEEVFGVGRKNTERGTDANEAGLNDALIGITDEAAEHVNALLAIFLNEC